MMNIKKYHPGIFIKDALESLDMKSNEFAMRTGVSERTLSSIINEEGSITFDVAFKLSKFFGNSVNFWTNLQNDYDLYKRNEKEKEIFKEEQKLLKPIKNYLFDSGIINESMSNEEIILASRQYVSVNNLTLLNTKDYMVCFKKQSGPIEETHFYQNFWIALSLKEARNKEVSVYDKKKVENYIPEIKSLTTKDGEYISKRLDEIFKDCGISFVLVPYLPKSRIYGVTKWINSNKVMLAISNRGERADYFWFTLLHELGHVLLEHKREAIISFDGSEDNYADSFARDVLIDKEHRNKFVEAGRFTPYTIKKFALKESILPIIVVGRLQKEKYIPYNCFTKEFMHSYKIVQESNY